MSAPGSPAPRLLLGSVLLSAAGALGLQRALAAVWPQDIDSFTGLSMWRTSSLAFGVCLGLLVALPSRGRVKEGGLLLGALAPLAVTAGNVVPGCGALLGDLSRLSPLQEPILLLAQLPRVYAPLLLILAALPVPMLLRSLWTRGPARWAGLAGALAAFSTAALYVTWARTWLEAREALLASTSGFAAQEALGWGWSLIPAVACVLTVAWLVAARARAAALVWATLLVLLVDPLPVMMLRLYGSLETLELPVTQGPGLGSSLPLLELGSVPARFDGQVLDQPLAERLERAGFTDQGPGFLVDHFPPDPWDTKLQRALQLAPPATATCAGITPTLAVARRYGVTIWHWPGQAPENTGGVLAPAMAFPVISVLVYPPPATPPCVALHLGERDATLVKRDAAPHRFVLPGEVEALAATVATCSGPLEVAPRRETPLLLLFDTLDRLAGTHPAATHRGRVALRWPGLDPEVEDRAGGESEMQKGPSVRKGL